MSVSKLRIISPEQDEPVRRYAHMLLTRIYNFRKIVNKNLPSERIVKFQINLATVASNSNEAQFSMPHGYVRR